MSSNSDATEVELVCQVKDEKVWKSFLESLESRNDIPGVSVLASDFSTQSVHLRLVSSQLSKSMIELQKDIEKKTGVNTVIKGVGAEACSVCELTGSTGVMGVVRLAQVNGEGSSRKCLVDGVIDRLPSGRRASLTLHPYGDLSGTNFENIGDTEKILKEDLNPVNGVSSFHFILPDCYVSSVIGKSMAVIQEPLPQSLTERVLAAGIIARASTVGMNTKKKICVCSGKTLWEEKKELESLANQSKKRE